MPTSFMGILYAMYPGLQQAIKRMGGLKNCARLNTDRFQFVETEGKHWLMLPGQKPPVDQRGYGDDLCDDEHCSSSDEGFALTEESSSDEEFELTEENAYHALEQFLQQKGPIPSSDLAFAYDMYPGLRGAIHRHGGAKKFIARHGSFSWGAWCGNPWIMLKRQTLTFDIVRNWTLYRQEARKAEAEDSSQETTNSDSDSEDDPESVWHLTEDDPAYYGLYFGPGGYVGHIGDGVMEHQALPCGRSRY